MKKLVIALAVALFSLPLFAQKPDREASDSARIYFRQGKYDINLSLQNNGVELERICKVIEKALEEGKVEKMSIEATASPEGGYEYNQQLTKNRANAIIGYIRERFPNIPDHKIESVGRGVAWDLLRDRLLQIPDSQLSAKYKEGLIDIIDNVDETEVGKDGKTITKRLNAMKAYEGGVPYKWIYNNIFPNLRSGVALYLFLYPVPMDPPTPPTPPEPEPEPKPFYMNLKTNLLYDAATVPNLGVEFYLGKNWSLSVMAGFAWWNFKKSHMWIRDHGVEIEARKWFGALAEQKPLQGHHIGPYVMAQTYDFQLAGKLPKLDIDDPLKGFGYQSKFSAGAGVSYGYSLPIGKRLNLDFEVGLGFLIGKGYEYKTNTHGYTLDQNDPEGRTFMELNGGIDATAKDNQTEWYKKNSPGEHHSPFVTPADDNGQSTIWFVGPTKLGVTLVWQLGQLNVNKR